MKPKISKSSSKKNGVCVSHKPILSFFKPLSTRTPERGNPLVNFSPVKTPTSSSNSLRPPRAKISEAARQNGLTPVKLKFEFDFVKIPSCPTPVGPQSPLLFPSSSSPTRTPPLTPPTYSPLTPTPPPTPKSQRSHQSPLSSVQAPPFSPITPPLQKMPKKETPTSHHKKRKRPKKKSPKPKEIIVISSGSDSDICHQPKKMCHTKRNVFIVIDSIESDKTPEPKRRKISKDNTTTPAPSVVRNLKKKIAKCDTSVAKQTKTHRVTMCSTSALMSPKQTVTPPVKSCNTPVVFCSALVPPKQIVALRATTQSTSSKPTSVKPSHAVCPKPKSSDPMCVKPSRPVGPKPSNPTTVKPSTCNPMNPKPSVPTSVKPSTSNPTSSKPSDPVSPKPSHLKSSNPVSIKPSCPPSPYPKSKPPQPMVVKPSPPKPPSVLKVPRYLLEDTVNQDTQSELLVLLWKRCTPHFKIKDDGGSPPKVNLFNAAQRTFVETYLDSDCRYLSDKFAALAGYLTTATSATRMPRGEDLATLFLLLCDSNVSMNRLHPSVRDACVRYFSHLLHVHPPGSHKVVDVQYRLFLGALAKRGQTFSLWELLQTLARFSGHCCHLLSFLVDLLLSDYWATLHNGRSKPLFLQVFWADQESPRVNPTVRELLKELNNLLQSFADSNYEFLILESLCALLYLCGNVCDSLSTELVSLCLSLPSDGVHTFLGQIHSLSLYLHLYRVLPTEKTRSVFVDCQEQNGEKLEQENSEEIEQKGSKQKNVLCSSPSKNKFPCVRKRIEFSSLPRRPIHENNKLKTCENCSHQTCIRCTMSQTIL